MLEAVTPTPELTPEAAPPSGTVATPEPVVANNVLTNGGFEAATTSWNQCGPSDNALLVSNDQAAGGRAVKIFAGGCIYQEVAASQGEAYKLSCEAKRIGPEWSIMEISYLDVNYNNLRTELKQITHLGDNYTNNSVSGLAPVGTAYVAALLYSEADSLSLIHI